jgi:dimethylargininase
MFTRAIVRPPAPNFGEGLTTSGLGRPDYERALAQHAAYCAALEKCGLTLSRLEPDPNYPDSCFVEDAAVIVSVLPNDRANASVAVLTRPGAPSRRGEVESLRAILADFFPSLHEIQSPGTLDGGDICQAGRHFFIGLSARTNEAGAIQLSRFLEDAGYTTSLVDTGVRVSTLVGSTAVPDNNRTSVGTMTASAFEPLLHLKSGLAYLGDKRLAITDALVNRLEFAAYDLVAVTEAENYAANCVRVNDYVLIADGYPHIHDQLTRIGYETIALEMSEFRKMDGGLSCLSLRF